VLVSSLASTHLLRFGQKNLSWGKFQRRPFDTNSPAVRIACLTEKILRFLAKSHYVSFLNSFEQHSLVCFGQVLVGNHNSRLSQPRSSRAFTANLWLHVIWKKYQCNEHRLHTSSYIHTLHVVQKLYIIHTCTILTEESYVQIKLHACVCASYTRNCGIYSVRVCVYQKFRSQTSDNMDRWKSRGGQSQRRERVRRRKIKEREKVEKLRKTVFSNVLWLRMRSHWADVKSEIASRFGSQNVKDTSGSEHFWKLRRSKSARRCVHAVVARSVFRSQNVQSTPRSEHFWKCRCWKSAR
jgi:hypothetical protein